MRQPDLLMNRLNFDAIVFSGCTMKELQHIVLASLAFAIAIMGSLSSLLFGMFMIGVGLAFPTTVVLTWVLAKVLQRIKQGRPKGYIKQRVLLWLEDAGLKASPYVRRSGRWSVGRWL